MAHLVVHDVLEYHPQGHVNKVWRCTSVIPELWRWRQGWQKFEASQGYMRSCVKNKNKQANQSCSFLLYNCDSEQPQVKPRNWDCHRKTSIPPGLSLKDVFSVSTFIKMKNRNKIDAECLFIFARSNIHPWIQELIKKKNAPFISLKDVHCSLPFTFHNDL